MSSTLPVVGTALFTRCGVRSFHSLLRSCIASFWTSITHRLVLDFSLCLLASCLGIIQSSVSVVFARTLASRKYSSLSVLLRLLDVLMAFLEVHVGELFARGADSSLTYCAWSAGLTSTVFRYVHVVILFWQTACVCGCDRASCGSLRSLGVHPRQSSSSRALQLRSCSSAAAPDAMATCASWSVGTSRRRHACTD